MEKYGAASDNLLSARVVTVDGIQVKAPSPKSNPDLLGAVSVGEAANFRGGHGTGIPAPSGQQVLSGALTYAPDAFQISCRLSSSFLLGPRMKWTRLPSCCHPGRPKNFKVDVCIAAIPEWEMICSGRCVLSSRRMVASRSSPTWKLRRPVDFLQHRLRTSKQISFFEN